MYRFIIIIIINLTTLLYLENKYKKKNFTVYCYVHDFFNFLEKYIGINLICLY